MAKQEWIPDEIKKEIYGFVASQPANLKREKILDELTKHLKKYNPDCRIPADTTLLNAISEIRNRPDPEGIPWCIGAKLDIPHEALPAVLQCWKEAQLSDSSFTVREAKWCARLSAFVKDSWTLKSWAWGYANRERAYELLGLDLDTSDFDTILTTPPWELVTGYLTGEIKPVVHGIYLPDRVGRRIVPREALPEGSSDRFQYPVTPCSFTPVIIALAPISFYASAHIAEIQFLGGPGLDNKEVTDIVFRESLSEYVIITPLGELHFSQEQVRVYTLWLQYLAKGPHIKSLAKEPDAEKGFKEYEKRLQIGYDLREWVKNHELAKNSSRLLPNAVDPDFLDYLDTQYKLKPVELLKRVGYEV